MRAGCETDSSRSRSSSAQAVPAHLDVLVDELSGAGAEPGSGAPKLFRALGREPEAGRGGNTPFEKLRVRLRDAAPRSRASRSRHTAWPDPESLHDMRVAVRRFRALLRTGRPLLLTDTRGARRAVARARRRTRRRSRPRCSPERLGDEAPSSASPTSRREAAPHSTLPRASEDKRRRLRSCSARTPTSRCSTTPPLRSTRSNRATPGCHSTSWRPRRRERSARLSAPSRPSRATTSSTRCGRPSNERATPPSSPGRREIVRRAKALQDVLGEHQDAVVASQRLRELAANAPGEQALAAGRLVEREDEQPRRRARAVAGAWKRLRKVL